MLQSTVKVLLCPTKALLRPGPLLSTLLASESVGLGTELWVKLLLFDRTAGSTVKVDVSLALVTFTNRGPERTTGIITLNFKELIYYVLFIKLNGNKCTLY